MDRQPPNPVVRGGTVERIALIRLIHKEAECAQTDLTRQGSHKEVVDLKGDVLGELCGSVNTERSSSDIRFWVNGLHGNAD